MSIEEAQLDLSEGVSSLPLGVEGETFSVSRLRIGEALERDIYDPTGVKLLGEGTTITTSFVEALKARGIMTVSTSASGGSASTEELADRTTGESEPLASDAEVCAELGGSVRGLVEKPADASAYALEGLTRPAKKRLSPEAFEAVSQEATAAAERLFDDWEASGGEWLPRSGGSSLSSEAASMKLDAGPAADMLEEVLPVMTLDVDVAGVMLSMSRSSRAPLLAHGVRSAMCAMHLAYHLGYPKARILDAGLTGLLADVGMARVPDRVLRMERFGPGEWLEVRRHAAYSSDLLEHAAVPRDVRIAIYQHHERLDGSGYPHGRKAFFVHPLAKLVAVADVYAALAEPRLHRPAQSAHHAVRAVLQGIKAGQLDGQVGKVLVDTVGLFPVGTRLTVQVGGSEPMEVEVLRTKDDSPTKPFVVQLDGRGERTKKKLDLSTREDVKVCDVHGPGDEPLSPAA